MVLAFIPKLCEPIYSIDYGKVFGSYDIDQVDQFINGNPQITYKNLSGIYEELRPNLIQAFEEKRFKNCRSRAEIYDESTDGRDHYFWFYVRADFNGKEVWEFVELENERVGYCSYGITSIRCDDELFGYMFFGKDALEETVKGGSQED